MDWGHPGPLGRSGGDGHPDFGDGEMDNRRGLKMEGRGHN